MKYLNRQTQVEDGIETPRAATYVFPLMWIPAVAGLLTNFRYRRNVRGIV